MEYSFSILSFRIRRQKLNDVNWNILKKCRTVFTRFFFSLNLMLVFLKAWSDIAQTTKTKQQKVSCKRQTWENQRKTLWLLKKTSFAFLSLCFLHILYLTKPLPRVLHFNMYKTECVSSVFYLPIDLICIFSFSHRCLSHEIIHVLTGTDVKKTEELFTTPAICRSDLLQGFYRRLLLKRRRQSGIGFLSFFPFSVGRQA